MTRLHTAAAAVLLSAAVLFGGCSVQPENSDRSSGQNDISNTLNGSSYDNSFDISDTSSSDSSSDNSSSDPKPDIELMFTEQDLELQAILKDLVANAEEIDGMFTHLKPSGDKYILDFDFANGFLPYHNEYYIVSEDQRTNNGLFAVPQSYDEMEKLVSEYFSSQAAEFYMKNCYHGTLTGSQNGTLFVDLGQYSPPGKGFIEINGDMYYADWREEEYPGMGIDCETARITRQTDTIIEFTYFGRYYNVYNDVYSEKTGFLVKESGVWKLRYLCGYGFAPEIPTEYTEQDLELQEILNSLKPGDEITDLFMIGNLLDGTSYDFAFPEITNKYDCHTYYDASTLDWKRNSPRSCDELEQRLLQYFTREATDRYMSKVSKGTMTTEDDVRYYVLLDKDTGFRPIYVEIDGKMYCCWDAGVFESTSILCDTAKVIEKTHDTIVFTHAVADYANFHTKTERIVFERGNWMRDPFYRPPEVDNKELQDLLRDLVANAEDIDGIFTRLSEQGEGYRLKVNDMYYGDTYYPITDNRITEPSGFFFVPQTRSELEQLLLTCFTERAVEYYMDDIGTGHMIIDNDGKNVINAPNEYKTYLEVDGRLYYCPRWGGHRLDIDCTTAKVISKTDKTIKFTYSDSSGTPGETEGVIMFENGRWKLDFFHGKFIPELPTEFTEKDLELQNILNELSDAYTIFCWFNIGASYDAAEFLEFRLDNSGSYPELYALMPKGEKASYCDLEYPRSCEELEELLPKYFTQKTADYFMKYVSKGTMTENPDGTYTVAADHGYRIDPAFIEIDGNMYLHVVPKDGPASPMWDTAQVTEKTPDSIKFTVIHTYLASYFPEDGLIKFERGGWKLIYDTHSIKADERFE